jgi:hypothetical protein
MVGMAGVIIYYGLLLGFMGVAMTVHVAGDLAKKELPHHAAKFDVYKDCEIFNVDSPISYYEDSVDTIKARSGKNCVIRVITYRIDEENAVSPVPAATLDTSHSVPGVLELPSSASR